MWREAQTRLGAGEAGLMRRHLNRASSSLPNHGFEPHLGAHSRNTVILRRLPYPARAEAILTPVLLWDCVAHLLTNQFVATESMKSIG